MLSLFGFLAMSTTIQTNNFVDVYHLYEKPRLPIVQMIVGAAEEFSVSPALLLSIAHTETRFDPTLISRTGDIGLMQINCHFWSSFFGFKNEKSCRNILKNPRINIEYSIRILNEFLKFEMCLDNNLYACYNGGPKWFKSKNRKDILRYYKNVKKRRMIMDSIYGDKFESFIRKEKEIENKWIT